MDFFVFNYMIFRTIRLIGDKSIGDVYIKAPDISSASGIAFQYGLILFGVYNGNPPIDEINIILVMPETPYAPSIPSEIAN